MTLIDFITASLLLEAKAFSSCISSIEVKADAMSCPGTTDDTTGTAWLTVASAPMLSRIKPLQSTVPFIAGKPAGRGVIV